MKFALVLLAVAVSGANALGIPSLAYINETAQSVINTTHNVNGQVISLVDSTNQDAAGYVKDVSQTNTLWLQDGYDNVGDKTKDAIQIAQDKTNQLLGIIGQLGGPLQVGANLGSKATDLAADAGKTMTNVAVGAAQLGTSVNNQALGAAVDKMAAASSIVAGAASKANDFSSNLASAGVNKVVKVTSAVGGGIGNAISAIGKGVSSWAKLSP